MPVAVAVSVAAAVGVGESVTVSRSRAIVAVYLVAALAAIARRGVMGFAQLLAGTLPWLVVAGDKLPRLTETFAAGAVTALLFLVVAVRRDGTSMSFLLRVGIVCFYGPVLLSLALEGSGEQFIQAAKYVVFPAVVLAVTQATNDRRLMALRTTALWSGTAAVVVNLMLGLAGFGGFTDYNAGEIAGFGRTHDLALLAGCITAAGLAAANSLRSSGAVVAGAIATIATGVRSTLPGLAVLTVVRMVARGARLRTILLVALAVGAVFLSGAAGVVEARFQSGESRGEFKSFSALGSGRGEIYTVALDHWRASSAIHWFIGTGLRSIPRFEQESLGSPLVGHSDIIEVGVQLGIIGLAGLVMIWWVLVARAQSKSPLLVLASFSVFNGALEYSAPLVVAVLLTAGARHARDRAPAGRPGRARPLASSRLGPRYRPAQRI